MKNPHPEWGSPHEPEWAFRAVAMIDRLAGQLAELQEAVTPSASTKMAYMGEFSFFETYLDEDGNEESQEIIVQPENAFVQ
jgi:hypothetical protein